MSNPRYLLVDGDIIAYKTAFKYESDEVWRREFGDSCLDDALKSVDTWIQSMEDRCNTDDTIVCLTDYRNFRKQLGTLDYKANRKDKPKPLLLYDIYDYLRDNYSCEMWAGVEADDVLGILMSRYPDSIISSGDKDLLQIPGKHYVWKDDEIISVTIYRGQHWFYTQVLTGDTADGYTGVPGIGPKKAEKILGECTTEGELWNAVVKTYESKGLTEDDAVLQARYAYILRSDMDYINTEDETKVRLWSPEGRVETWIPIET